MSKIHELGHKGERIAQSFLKKKNYTILQTNWRWQKAEIDIIAKNENCIVFIEVKTRSTTRFGEPSEFVSMKKIELMKDAAEAYLEVFKLENEIRFDIISIVINSDTQKIQHLINII